MKIGQTPISAISVDPKSKNSLDQIMIALKEIYCNPEYNERIFNIIEKHLPQVDHNNGRPGMDLWTIFVLGQVRHSKGYCYDELHNLANNHRLLRQLIGIVDDFVLEPYKFDYQNIYDNVKLFTESMFLEINEVIVDFGHKVVFKKKENEAMRLKSDSFVVKSNVHFPTDYNLLWDCSRKCIDTVCYFLKKYPQLAGWRKIKNWRSELKSMMREVGRISGSGGKKKEEKLQKATTSYLNKCRMLHLKLMLAKGEFPICTSIDLAHLID
jgi:hypothetical protein